MAKTTRWSVLGHEEEYSSLEQAELENPEYTWFVKTTYRVLPDGIEHNVRAVGICTDPDCTCDGSVDYYDDES